MKELHRKDRSGLPDPKSCARHRKVSGEALIGVHADQPLNCEIEWSGVPTLLTEAEGHISGNDTSELPEDSAQSKTLCMRGNSMHGSREIPEAPVRDGRTGRSEKVNDRSADMHASGKSDGCTIPKKLPNKDGVDTSAEAMEGRQPIKGNTEQTTTLRTQSRESVSIRLQSVREAARKGKGMKFTALLHHVTTDLLRESFLALKRQATPGVDGITWEQYADGLEDRLEDLHERVQRGSYRAQPSRRAYIAKPDGRMRPLGVAALEDKIVQAAVVRVLEAIYEEEFLGFSYGFRPGRNPHQALDALWMGITGRKVSWVLDADIQGFFDTINHEWLMRFLEHRIADKRVLRLVRKWLRAGVSENGHWSATEVGTPQGAVISPLLGNVFLHHVLDQWVNLWRKRHARGDVIIVRYADDFVMGFQHRAVAEKCLKELQERMRKFGLNLHPGKTRLIEFGRFAAHNRQQRDEDRPETFDFLGFTHFCGEKFRKRGFIVRRKTVAHRLRAAIQTVKATLKRNRHVAVTVQGTWLRRVVTGYFNYHAIPGNAPALRTFHREVARAWLQALRRRGQRHAMTWKRLTPLLRKWLPDVRILHPHPYESFCAMHPR